MTDEIKELDMTVVGRDPDGRKRYNFPRSGLPWIRVTQEVRDTKAMAFDEAVRWCRDYEKADPFGNFANVLGVTKVDGGWKGVINYYHSNT